LTTGGRVTMGRRAVLVPANAGPERSVEISVTPLRFEGKDILGLVLVLHDTSELRGLARQMTYQASHDALTGLVNRREFERRLQEAMDSAQTGNVGHALCYLDLDRFKVVNDTCGHTAGDNMLREVASLIKEAVRDSDTVGRIGGDEFALLLVGCPLEKARQIADDVVRSVNDYRFVWKDKIFNIGVSIGLVEIGSSGGAIEDIMNSADSACYVAKKQGGLHVHVYSAREEASARHSGEIHWLQRLQGALRDNKFELYYQPIVHARADGVRGPALEVFVRLKGENGQPGTPPSEFIRAAERYRLMPHIDRWVVQAVLSALGRGGMRLPPGRSVAINIAGQTLGDSDFLEFVVDCFDHTGANPGDICFEVTEGAVVANLDHAHRFIAVLHGMGCEFALDDFGSGLSSFSTLRTLPMDYVKIDGSFIHNLAADTVNQAMVTAMIELSRSLNFRVVAEQVEDQLSLDTVIGMGIDFVQGFVVGRPQPLSMVPSPV
jgi:diguanylate cyclase (GGDEF)-like protein